METPSDAYVHSVLDRDYLVSLAVDTASLAYGRVPTQAGAGREFWELGHIVRERIRRTSRSVDGTFDFGGNIEGDLVGLKPDGQLVEVRFVQSAGSNNGPPPLELGSPQTRWEEGPFEEDWHFELLDEANLGNAKEEYRIEASGSTHTESLEPSFVSIVERRGHGLERSLKNLAASARRAIENDESVPSGIIQPLNNGIYLCNEGDVALLLRFLDDDIVTCSTSGAGIDVARKFDWDRVELPRGKYSMTANHIEFLTRTVSGAVTYKGTMQSPTRILLNSYNHINGTVRKGSVFDFFEVDFDPVTAEYPVDTRQDLSSDVNSAMAAHRPTTWNELLEYLQATYPLDNSRSAWPTIQFTVDDGRSQWVTIRPRGAPERGRVELITPFATYSEPAAAHILSDVYDIAFGGVVKIGDTLHFRDTFQLGKLDMEEFHDLIGFVAGIGDILEIRHGEGDVF